MKMKNYFLAGLILITTTSFLGLNKNEYPPIITRHDKDDADFIELAKRFQKVMCHLNLPDCEGTIIDDNWAVSAAHCSIEIQEKLKRGEKHFVIINEMEFEVDRVIIHRKWKKDEAYDIALLHFKGKPIGIMHAELYKTEDEMDKIVYMVGKGDKGDGLIGINGNDGILRAATNKVEEATDYWLKWTFDNPDTQSNYLTEYEGISGPGDSGGPAFILRGEKIYIAGISSGQSTKNSGGIEGVYGVKEYYTRVSQYIKWIERKIK